MKHYGKELILDLHNCDPVTFTRIVIEKYFEELCDLIDMERETLHWWDYEDFPEEYKKAPPHLKGISAIQFIKTSNIIVHTLDELKRIYVNIFSCKDFNAKVARVFTEKTFKGVTLNGSGEGIIICRM